MENNGLIKYQGGLINHVGNAISVTNKLLATTEPQLIPYRKKDKWGFCTPDKKIVIDCVYDDAEPFQEGLACVKINGKYGFINKSGTFDIPCKYDKVFGGFTNNVTHVVLKFQSGLIDKTGTEIVPCKYASVNFSPKEELIGIRQYHYSARVLLKTGLVSQKMYSDWICNGDKYELKSGFIDKENNIIIPIIYQEVSKFSESLCTVKLNNKYGFLDELGNTILPIIYDSASSFSEGLASVKSNGKSLYIDQAGNEIIVTNYETAFQFKEGFAKVNINPTNSYFRKYGFIDKKGNEIIPCVYDNAEYFSEGLAVVNINDNYLFSNYGFIDTSGAEIFPCKFGEASSFKNGIARVKLKAKYMVIDQSGGYINKYGDQYWED